MSVGGEFGRRVSDDELCTEVLKAVRENDGVQLLSLLFHVMA